MEDKRQETQKLRMSADWLVTMKLRNLRGGVLYSIDSKFSFELSENSELSELSRVGDLRNGFLIAMTSGAQATSLCSASCLVRPSLLLLNW
ncbi:hypothetical protein HBI56_030450 [Parastagonospora nodorum]|nr:hypothetical protein HBH53_028510 [Parastagonospora nodorum]KAH3990251.1 hypothetical protein HBH52_005310 [Parastagonospora nodorum]KAH4034893.1 hypothetical protein HBI09_104590 [Parastagonospora nodorum]KAH4059364.1 hypothetical protein HBH49_017230 [Parastagonospora nodorum]KAH4074819.1 hypothetical protein HBH50_030250 [Parastagonospora nodorum]